MDKKTIRKLQKKIFRDFLKSRDFSDFEKESLRTLNSVLFAAYSFYRNNYYEYLKEKEDLFDTLIKDLDEKSKNTAKALIKDARYLKEHNFYEILQDFLNRKEEIIKHLNFLNEHRNLKLPINTYEQSVFEYHHGLVNLSKERLSSLKNKDFIDCGAFMGDSALVFEKFYHPKRIYSFEPDEENYNFMLETIKLNSLEKVIPKNIGVGDKSQNANFFHMAGASHISNNKNDSMVKIIPIDQFVSENNLDVGLIKMDVEGYELNALRGAKKTINKFKPVLCLAVYHNAAQLINVLKFLKDLNLEYKIMIRHLSDFVPINETAIIAY